MMPNNEGYPVKSPAEKKKESLYTYSYSLTFNLEINNYFFPPLVCFHQLSDRFCTVNSLHSGHCTDLELVSSLGIFRYFRYFIYLPHDYNNHKKMPKKKNEGRDGEEA